MCNNYRKWESVNKNADVRLDSLTCRQVMTS